MPGVYPQQGPGLPGNPALDGLREAGALSGTGSGSTGPLNRNRLTEPPDPTQMLDALIREGRGFGVKAPPALAEKAPPLTTG